MLRFILLKIGGTSIREECLDKLHNLLEEGGSTGKVKGPIVWSVREERELGPHGKPQLDHDRQEKQKKAQVDLETWEDQR